MAALQEVLYASLNCATDEFSPSANFAMSSIVRVLSLSLLRRHGAAGELFNGPTHLFRRRGLF